jgi:hypothetical protein
MNGTRWAIRAGYEGDVARQPIQLGYHDAAFLGFRRRQGSCQLRAPFQRVGPFAAFEFDKFSRNGQRLSRGKSLDCGPLRINPKTGSLLLPG